MTEAVIVATARTPIGRAFKGSLKDVRPDDLSDAGRARPARQAAGARPRDASTTCTGAAPTRAASRAPTWPAVVAVLAGLDHLPAATVNRFCACSTQTTRMAFHAIKAGEGDAFVVGGVECVSQYTELRRRRAAATPRSPEPAVRRCRRAQRRDRPHQRRPGPTRARTACCPTSTSRWARPPRTSPPRAASRRQRQDEWGVASQNRAEKAIADGFFAREIIPVTLADGTVVARDDGPRAGVTLEARAGAQPGVPRERHRHRRQLLPAQRRRRRRGRHERRPGRASSG